MSRLNGSVVKERFHCAVIGQWKRTQVMDCFVWGDLGEWGEVPKGSSDPFFSCQTTLLSLENGKYGNEILLKGDLRMDFDGCS